MRNGFYSWIYPMENMRSNFDGGTQFLVLYGRKLFRMSEMMENGGNGRVPLPPSVMGIGKTLIRRFA